MVRLLKMYPSHWRNLKMLRMGKRLATLIVITLLLYWYGAFELPSSNKKQNFDALPVERVCQNDMVTEQKSHARPLIIFCSGGSRTGTTYTYNLLRILLRQRDPNLISGWYEDLSFAAARYASPKPPKSPILHGGGEDMNSWNGALDSYRNTGTTILVKVHNLGIATRLFTGCDGPDEINSESCPVDMIVSTHRDLGPQVASIRRMGWAKIISRREILSDPFEFCRKRKNPINKRKPYVSDKDWSEKETWLVQALALVKCHNEWRVAGGQKIKVDVAMEDTLAAGFDMRVKLANQITIAVTEFDNSTWEHSSPDSMRAVDAVQEADALRPLSCSSWQAVNPMTHLHRGHVSTSNSMDPVFEKDKNMGIYAIGNAEDSLKKWRQEHGFIGIGL